MSIVERIPGDPALLLLCDHAANAVPADIDLGIAPALLDRHIAVDIGAAPLTRALAAATGGGAMLATVSRLVADLNRSPDDPAAIPELSDGHVIPGNVGIDRADRIARYHAPYHDAVAAAVARRPALIVAVHSFTARLESGDAPARRWEVGILSNRDRRAADPAIAFLASRGLIVGDNEPYSGRLLNATLDRHAEANGIASISVEVRNDLIAQPGGVARWSLIVAEMIAHVRNRLA